MDVHIPLASNWIIDASIYVTLYDIIDSPDREATKNAVRTLLPEPDTEDHSELPILRSHQINYIVCYVQRSGSTHLISLLEGTGRASLPIFSTWNINTFHWRSGKCLTERVHTALQTPLRSITFEVFRIPSHFSATVANG
jgi:hypothetical protein